MLSISRGSIGRGCASSPRSEHLGGVWHQRQPWTRTQALPWTTCSRLSGSGAGPCGVLHVLVLGIPPPSIFPGRCLLQRRGGPLVQRPSTQQQLLDSRATTQLFYTMGRKQESYEAITVQDVCERLRCRC
ncbi:uncharacterized protein LOC134782084 [Penaeus indicus]|uniref:uncharacterized protein LOC134782084 n=1 Tax=Penaeus indicus TaxID=29960 RepID=UPI00300DB2DA